MDRSANAIGGRSGVRNFLRSMMPGSYRPAWRDAADRGNACHLDLRQSRKRAPVPDKAPPMKTFNRLVLTLLLALAWPSLAAAQVDINSADAKTLAETLSGVGLVKAEAIVAYRASNGPFRKIEDLGKVKGIGAKTIEANREAIVIVATPAAAHGQAHGGKPLAAD